MDRFSIVLGHYVFCANNHTGQGCALYKRMCRIARYYKPSDSAWNLNAEGNETALEVYNNLASKYDLPLYSEN